MKPAMAIHNGRLKGMMPLPEPLFGFELGMSPETFDMVKEKKGAAAEGRGKSQRRPTRRGPQGTGWPHARLKTQLPYPCQRPRCMRWPQERTHGHTIDDKE